MRTDADWTHASRPGSVRVARLGLVPAAVLAGSLGVATLAGATQPQAVVTTAKVNGLGTVLVASHRVLYEKANDPKGHSTCTGGCTTIWPPLIVSSKTAHHLGHIAGLGTIKRSNGKLQVAMHGHALYFNAGDHSLSQANGQGFQNNWFTVHSNGSLDRATISSGTAVTAPPTSQPASSPSSPTTTRPTSAPSHSSTPTSPAPTSPAPTSPPPTAPPTTSATTQPPPPPTTQPPPPTTTTTTSGGGGGVGF